MDDSALPLYPVFERLRAAGLPLGVDDYALAIRALQRGFGVGDRAALLRLCRTLWATSREEQTTVDEVFAQVMVVAAPERPVPPDLRPPAASNRPTAGDTSAADATPTPSATPPLVSVDDPVQVAKAVRTPTTRDPETAPVRFVQATEYFPLTRRQLKQRWRTLRRPVREGPPVELDISATIAQIGRQGQLVAPVRVPRRINRTQLVLLLDQRGSMVPFHSLSRRLLETAVRGGRLGRTDVYYFHDCPADHLYTDPDFTQPEALPGLYRHFAPRTAVLIFSDAGAARGDLDPARAVRTRRFLTALGQHVRFIAWLNPMPPMRWGATTAAVIAKDVAMFPLTRDGMDGALAVLRGRHGPMPGGAYER